MLCLYEKKNQENRLKVENAQHQKQFIAELKDVIGTYRRN